MRSISCFAALVLIAAIASADPYPRVDAFGRVVEVSDGSRLATTITLPEGESSPRHPLLFTQWVSCGSLEYREDSNSRELLAALARQSGLALVLVERSAVDGTGPSCAELDYDTEIDHYVEAFTELLGDRRIDASRVFVYGSSLGSTTAPLVATELQRRGFDIAGIMVQGGGGVSYYERMLAFDRIYLERRPAEVAPADVQPEFLLRAKFNYEYLVEGRHPDEVAADSPGMARVRSDILGLGDSDHYGRPYAWHQQAARRNFLAAWAELDAPVLVIFNEFDQFESRHGHRLIVDTVNRLRPGTATYVERAGIGHSDNRYDDIVQAYPREGGTPAWGGAAEIMLHWLKTLD